MMKTFALLAAILSLEITIPVAGFTVPTAWSGSISSSATPKSPLHQLRASSSSFGEHHAGVVARRALLSNIATSSLLLLLPSASNAATVPSVTSSEFDIILKDSAKSILVGTSTSCFGLLRRLNNFSLFNFLLILNHLNHLVELSGSKSETAIVKLVDGTTFSISDLVESSTDPRSPMKLVARCRLYNVPIKNVGLMSALSGDSGLKIGESGKKKRVYMNENVQKAEVKEKEKRERMAEDERERLAELYRMEGEEKDFLSGGSGSQ
eukprot:scaffold502_cov192-Alexandrium_tamarense.AAC.15